MSELKTKNFEQMWFELKRHLLRPPSLTSKGEIFETMARIEINEDFSILRSKLFSIPPTAVEPEPPGVIKHETKGFRKFFRR